ncbi:hypothetical protein A3F08_02695 [Candidatus Berkelbacteria bacterium RIFCSPHIGHO2_12_FULL_36_9]|uniref:Response regulatory domain-containing protein n=1 Tax=Candidatus Berkelbacteria bacterium RIFCSPHIGHO2_12_FULL_36_9 TaxID=1797469 RepID=A0A1F5EDW7_9BACT|nr:MAG: hypothetical protein A3F08_02695 [Candidatus Berkelbacteria bacterium RIFCSPHIGHO2_12_FULL_36_9]
MPERARVFVAEDNSEWQKIIRRQLTRAGHDIVLEASSFDEAMEMVELAQKEGINVAVLDGSLDSSQSSMRCDGRIIAEALRKQVPGIKIIGLSGFIAKWADVDLGKMDAYMLGETITNLP